MQRLRLTLIIALSLLVGISSLMAQTQEVWRTFLARRHATQVATSSAGRVFVVADGALYAFDQERPEDITLYDRREGLSDTGIVDIAWVEETETLVIYYASGMIDLLGKRGVRTISALPDASHIHLYGLSAMHTRGTRVWLAGEFGLMQIDTQRALVEATYYIRHPMIGITLSPDGTHLYGLESSGVIVMGDLSVNLQDPSLWHIVTDIQPSSTISWREIAMTGAGHLLARASDGTLYQIASDGTRTSLADHLGAELGVLQYTALVPTPSGAVVALSSGKAVILGSDLSVSSVEVTGATDIASSASGSTLWVATGEALARLTHTADGWTATRVETPSDGPYSNSYFAMRHAHGRLYTVNGGRDGNRYSLPGVVQTFDGAHWSAVTSESLHAASGVRLTDPVDVIPHRDGDPTHYYVATWGEGLYEIREGALVERFDTHNSAIASAIPGTEGYTRVGSLSYDRHGTLWMGVALTASSSGGSIVSLSPEGVWQYYDYPSIRPTNSFGTQIAFPLGTKWIAEHRGNGDANGVFVYRDNGTPDISDDSYARYLSFTESSGKAVNFSRVSAMAVDRSGTLWLGTNIGYMSVVRPDQAPQTSRLPVISRPIGGTEPPYYYILDNVSITAIAVDALNRKWLGTESSGLYLISENGSEVLRHYRQENSPLVSNRILSLAMDTDEGILYIGTGAGLNSLDTGTAITEQSSTPTAIAFPNPLRPEHPDGISFDGLPAGATIHISDINGRVVHHAQSVDTTHRWDTYTTAGTRVPSGVYTARIYAPTGGKAQVIRIAVVRSGD